MKANDPVNAGTDRRYALATGKDFRDRSTISETMSAQEFVQRLSKPHVFEVTQKEYAALSPTEKAALKKQSGFVIPGRFGGFKTKSDCESRSIATLDMDTLEAEDVARVVETLTTLGNHAVVHSTASHRPAAPRLRAYIFLARDVSPGEYVAVIQYYERVLPTGAVSAESRKVAQLMYFPAHCSDGEWLFKEIHGQPLDVDRIIDTTQTFNTEGSRHSKPAWNKPGIVGKVAQLFEGDFDKAIHELGLPYVRSSPSATCGISEDRYSYVKGTSVDGAIWYPQDGHLYSWHSTDPCYSQSCTIFDVWRMHNASPDADDRNAPIHQRASHIATEEFFTGKYPILHEQSRSRATIGELDDLDETTTSFPSNSNAGRSGNERPFQLIPVPTDILTRAFPPREFICGQYGPLGATTLLLGEGAAGKSKFLRSLMLHGAAGIPFMGSSMTAGPYIYLNAEDDLGDVWRDLQKMLLTLPEGSRALAAQNFKVINAVGNGLTFSKAQEGMTKIDPVVDRIANEIGAARMVAIDTLSRINGADENSNAAMGAIEGACARLGQFTGASIWIVHHVAKSVARDAIVDKYAGRGGSALSDNSRSVLFLATASSKAAEGFGEVDPDEVRRGDILQLHHVKNSYGPKSETVWLRRAKDGLLQPFKPAKIFGADRHTQMFVQFVSWWRANGDVPFAKSGVTRSKRLLKKIWPMGVTESDATAFWDTQLEGGTFVDIGKSLKNGAAFQVNKRAAALALDEFAWGKEEAA